MVKKSFYSKVYAVVKKIPKGKILTYKQVAHLAGNSRAYRAVGSAMRLNPNLKTIPCHRVIGSDGRMHGYSAGQGVSTKIKLLKKEGVEFKGNRAVLNSVRN
jgi:O-6-methylguanine DNA methyltransferase